MSFVHTFDSTLPNEWLVVVYTSTSPAGLCRKCHVLFVFAHCTWWYSIHIGWIRSQLYLTHGVKRRVSYQRFFLSEEDLKVWLIMQNCFFVTHLKPPFVAACLCKAHLYLWPLVLAQKTFCCKEEPLSSWHLPPPLPPSACHSVNWLSVYLTLSKLLSQHSGPSMIHPALLQMASVGS